MRGSVGVAGPYELRQTSLPKALENNCRDYGVQLFGHRDIEPLFRDQQFHVATAVGGRHLRIENRLDEGSVGKTKWLDGAFARAVSALKTSRDPDDSIGQSNRAQNQAPASRAFQIGFGILHDRIFVQGGLNRGVQRQLFRVHGGGDDQNQPHSNKHFHF